MTDPIQVDAGRELRLYRPGNGSEGDWFKGKFCDRCVHDREWREHERNPCQILNATLCLHTDEEGYPAEWRYDENDRPTCTAFKEDASVPEPVPLTEAQIAAIEEDAERIAFEMFASAHPHEAHAEWPDRFWEFFRARRPYMTREQMVAALAATSADANFTPEKEPSDG